MLIPLLMLGRSYLAKGIKTIHGVMVAESTTLFILSTMLTFPYLNEHQTGATAEMLFRADTVWYAPLHASYPVGADGTSVTILLPSAVITFTDAFTFWGLQSLIEKCFLWFALSSMGISGFFISIDLFTMFTFYKIALISVYLLIGMWGSGHEEYAATKLTPILMGSSTFLLIGILGIFFGAGGTTVNILEIVWLHNISFVQQCIWFPLTLLGFGVLGALFLFHAWNPDGHASAPITAFMLYAGVLIELGGYGYFHIAIYLTLEAVNELGWVFPILAGILVTCDAFSACVQTDLEYVNAYPLVSHYGLIFFAILMANQTAATGAILQMLSHGLVTTLLFALIGMIYRRTHTHDICELNGLMKVIPSLSVCYVIVGFVNLGLPGLNGFVAEMTILVGPLQNLDIFYHTLTIIVCSSIVIAVVYILQLVGRILYGTCADKHHLILTDATWDECFAIICLIICVTGLSMTPLWVNHVIDENVLPVISYLVP